MLGISQKPVALNAANIDTLVFESENVFITCASNLPPCLLPPPRPPLSPDEDDVRAVYCPLLLGHSRCTRTAKARVSAPRVKAAMKRSLHIGASCGDTTAARGTDENHTWTNWGVAVGSNCFFFCMASHFHYSLLPLIVLWLMLLMSVDRCLVLQFCTSAADCLSRPLSFSHQRRRPEVH